MDLFDYALPADRIAQEARPRGASRLLVLERRTGAVSHRTFAALPDLVAPGDLLVRNDVRVRPARLHGRDPGGRAVELLLLERLEAGNRRWLTLAKPGRRARKGRILRFPAGVESVVEEVRSDGRREVLFDREIEDSLLDRIGSVPLPPYIRRTAGSLDRPEDRSGYQTIFAREALAVAAPTAGLHFTQDAFERIEARGCAVADLTLAIGAGTFKPVIAEDTSGHALDTEEIQLPAQTARLVAGRKAGDGRVVAVGTTVARSLEAAARLPEGLSGERDLRFATDLFITPGFEFRVVDALLTNFHLPRSSLLMLVCAFAGRERVLAAYEQAVREGYLFYSFGDAMLIA